MKLLESFESFNLLPGINICWYKWKNKTHYYIVFSWLFWYWSSLKDFAWEKEER